MFPKLEQVKSLRHAGREGGRRESIVQEKDLKNLSVWNARIRDVLIMRGDNACIQSLRDCFLLWQGMPRLQVENDAADIVLSAFYQQGKIRDYLDKLQIFTEQIDGMRDAEIVRTKGYYNYLYFLEQFMEEMQEKYIQAREKAESEELAEENMENVLRFIQNECSNVSWLRDLPGAREAVFRMKDSLKLGQIKTVTNKRDIALVSECIQFLRIAMREENCKEMEKVKEKLLQKKNAVTKNISRGNALYVVLQSEMNREWFAQFNPESHSCAVLEMEKEELKQFYRVRLAHIQEKIQEK